MFDLNEKLVVTLDNGIKLFTNDLVKNFGKSWALSHWGVKGVQVFIADDNGNRTFLLVKDGTPLHENKNYESICCWFDMWALANEYEQLQGWATVE